MEAEERVGRGSLGGKRMSATQDVAQSGAVHGSLAEGRDNEARAAERRRGRDRGRAEGEGEVIITVFAESGDTRLFLLIVLSVVATSATSQIPFHLNPTSRLASAIGWGSREGEHLCVFAASDGKRREVSDVFSGTI